MFRTNKNESILGTGMWASNGFIGGTNGVAGCCTFQTTEPAEEDYLPPCCVEVFLHDRKQFNSNGSVLRGTFPWPLTKLPA